MLNVYQYELLSPAEKVAYLAEQLDKNGMSKAELFDELVTELSSDYMRIIMTQIIAKYNLEVFEK